MQRRHRLRSTPACAGTTGRRSSSPAPCWVHPRLRGDHSSVRFTYRREGGPPPPARGPRIRCPRVGRPDRSTPACAGTTLAFVAMSILLGVHTRLRGDHRPHNRPSLRRRGPPPPARGPQAAARVCQSGVWSTPACAGTTSRSAPRQPRSRVHPRLRGDHTTAVPTDGRDQGPPPPARGPRAPGCRRSPAPRSTPACAGTTSTRPPNPAGPAVHPRLRGDHERRCSHCWETAGPPPPARGPQPTPKTNKVPPRSTPACAGTTAPISARAICGAVHPRLRGDHGISVSNMSDDKGPPPPARGPLRAARADRGRGGTTPACAGSTIARSRSVCRERVHPRLRGDHGHSDRFDV